MLEWTDEAVQLLREYVKTHTKKDGEIDWSSTATNLSGRSPQEARSKWKNMRRRDGEPSNSNTGAEQDQPSFQRLFEYLRDRERSLKQISNHFNVSPKMIEEKISQMSEKGYRLTISQESYLVSTSTVSQINPPQISIDDLSSKSFCIAVASDFHAGSRYSQPTSLNRFIKLAYEEYGVRHVMVPGDLTDGVFVYRGHLDELIPQCRPMTRDRSWMTAEAEAQLINIYLPKYDGLQYFVIGGNHDRSVITNSGMDPIRMACERRPDLHYGGYDVWSIRLTDRSYIRLVHPSGGIAYARSYRVQKAIENLAFEALAEAMKEEMPPMTSILVLAHFHLTNHSPEPPLHGVLAGCFQGQTPYLKAKNLVPHIAGLILEIKFETRGKLSQVAHRPIFFEEIEDDWKNWPTPIVQSPDLTADNLGSVIRGISEPTPPD